MKLYQVKSCKFNIDDDNVLIYTVKNSDGVVTKRAKFSFYLGFFLRDMVLT